MPNPGRDPAPNITLLSPRPPTSPGPNTSTTTNATNSTTIPSVIGRINITLDMPRPVRSNATTPPSNATTPGTNATRPSTGSPISSIGINLQLPGRASPSPSTGTSPPAGNATQPTNNAGRPATTPRLGNLGIGLQLGRRLQAQQGQQQGHSRKLSQYGRLGKVGGGVPWNRGTVKYGGSTVVPAAYGSRLLQDAGILSVVRSVVTKRQLPFRGSTSVYVVISSADIKMDGMCVDMCGYHGFGNIADPSTGQTASIKWAFVGSVASCFGACSDYKSAFDPTSINNNAEADGTASILAHEIVEAVSDPYLNAWYDGEYNENADKCSWEFGPGQQQTWDGKRWTTEVGGRRYLIQGNWNPAHNPATGWQFGCAWKA